MAKTAWNLHKAVHRNKRNEGSFAKLSGGKSSANRIG